MTTTFDLCLDGSEASWNVFVESFWEQRPGVFRSPSNDVLTSPDELFSIVQAATNGWDDNGERPFNIWIDGRGVSTDRQYYPISTDSSFGAYRQRLSSYSSSGEFTYSQNDLQVFNPHLWRRTAEYVAPLLKKIGIPSDGVELDTFFGQYRETPFGIHTDHASTFMHVLTGKKRMVVWPADYFDDKDVRIVGSPLRKGLEGGSVAEFIADGQILEGEAGEILYWPSGYWHVSIANDDRSFSAIANIGLFFAESTQSILTQMAQKALLRVHDGGNLKYSDPIPSINDSAYRHVLPERSLEILNDFRRIINSDAATDVITNLWYRRLSSGGFKNVPPSVSVDTSAIDDSHLVEWNVYPPLLWRSLSSHTMLFANGHTLNVRTHPQLSDFLENATNRSMETVANFSNQYNAAGLEAIGMSSHDLLVRLMSFRSVTLKDA